MTRIELKLIKAYQEIADLTAPECAKCKVPYSCCDSTYCAIAMEQAREFWKADLKKLMTEDYKNKKTSLWFMNLGGDTSKPIGCVVPPHMRISCTLHTCDISSFGIKMHDRKWTKQYFDLRDQLDKLERERYD